MEYLMEKNCLNIDKDLSDKTAIHQRLLSAVPVDMLDLIEKLDAEFDKEQTQEQDN